MNLIFNHLHLTYTLHCSYVIFSCRMPTYYECIVCRKRIKPKVRRRVSPHVREYLQEKLSIVSTNESDIICNRCIYNFYKVHVKVTKEKGPIKDRDFQLPVQRANPVFSPASVSLKIPGAPNTHSRCIICKRSGPKLIVIPSEARCWGVIRYILFI